MELIKTNKFELESRALVKAHQIFRAINHKLRQKMLGCLANEGKLDVTSLYQRLGIEQVVCSQHLAIMRSAGLVSAERAGKQVYYSVNHQQVEALQNMAFELIDF